MTAWVSTFIGVSVVGLMTAFRTDERVPVTADETEALALASARF